MKTIDEQELASCLAFRIALPSDKLLNIKATEAKNPYLLHSRKKRTATAARFLIIELGIRRPKAVMPLQPFFFLASAQVSMTMLSLHRRIAGCCSWMKAIFVEKSRRFRSQESASRQIRKKVNSQRNILHGLAYIPYKELFQPKISTKMGNRLFFRDITFDTPLRDCIAFNMLNSSAVEVCKQLELQTVGDLLIHHHKHFNFGARSTVEQVIFSFLAQLGQLDEQLLAKLEEDSPFALTLDEVQFESFTRQFMLKLQSLPVYLRKELLNLGTHKFYREYIKVGKSILFILGKQSIHTSSLEKLRVELRKFANELPHMPVSYEFDQLVKTCEASYGCQASDLEIFRPMAEAGEFPLYGFIAYLVDNGRLFSADERFVLSHHQGWLTGFEHLPMSEIMEHIEKGETSVLNLMTKLPRNIMKYLAPLKPHKAYIERQTKYDFDTKSPVIYFTKKMANALNHAEEANFHPSLFTVITWSIFQPERQLLNIKHGYSIKYYLVRKDVSDAFNFEAFLSQHDRHLHLYKRLGKWHDIMGQLRQYFRYQPTIYLPIVEDILSIIAADNAHPSPSSVELGQLIGNLELENAPKEWPQTSA